MKTMRLIMIASSMLALGCTSDGTRDFIPGTYVNSAGGEFSIASDTLRIELVEENNYVVHRSTGFNLISDSKIGSREYEQEEWRCIYSSETKMLTETKKGKLISFSPKKQVLLIGKRVYNKLN